MNLSFRNLLLPKRVPAERPWARVCIKLYRAEGLPSMSAGIMGGFSKIIGEKKVFIDPYVQVLFCGQQVSLTGGLHGADPPLAVQHHALGSFCRESPCATAIPLEMAGKEPKSCCLWQWPEPCGHGYVVSG